MKKLTSLVAAVAVAAIASSAVAGNSIIRLADPMTTLNPVLTIIPTTPDGHDLQLNGSLSVFIGKSESACSDLQLAGTSTDQEDLMVDNTVFALNSQMLVEAFGPTLTCLKIDWTNKGQTFSTGNVKLAWDQAKGAYSKATPAVVRIDFK